MGGVPVLLMVAALGVDYGWQPDGGGGVEYVIQVSPEQWDRVQELGEISSVIDPEVQGRVSRVIIRVGNEPVSRITPPRRPGDGPSRNSSTNAASNDLAAGDLVPMPIPEMKDVREAVPIPGGMTSGNRQSANEAVMKPDPNDTAAGGYTLPPSLQNAAESVGGAVRGAADQLKNDFANAAQSEFNAAVNQFRSESPTTATARAASTTTTTDEPPPFTGSDSSGGVARARSNGPSTEPASTQSRSWVPIGSTRETAQASSTASAPQSEPTANQGLGSGTANSSAGNSATNSGSASSGLSYPAPNEPPANGFGAGGGFGRVPESLRNEMASPATTTPSYQQAPTTNYQQQPAAATANDPRLYLPQAPLAQESGAAGSGAYSRQAPTHTPAAPNGYSRSEIDPRLSDAQRATGAFSVNAQGIPVDREGRPVAATGYASPYAPTADPYATETGPYSSRESERWTPSPTASLGAPNSSRNIDWEDTRNARLAANAAAEASERRAAESARPRQQRDEDDFASASDLTSPRTARVTSAELPASMPSGTLAPRTTVAAQPFFNGLLLLSIVGNFYLIFWLKNLRHQFRDLVAAKRMAQSGGGSV